MRLSLSIADSIPTDRLKKWLIAALAVGGVVILTVLASMGQGRLALSVTFLGIFITVATISIPVSIALVTGYLIFVGDLRRLLIPVIGWSGMDPLLLIGTAFAMVLCIYAAVTRSIKLDTALSRWTVFLMAVMAIQIFNPLQGGLVVGVAGIIFLMSPLFWFWIGRTYVSEDFLEKILFKVVIPISILAMLMGFYQRFFGYLPYQMRWYEIAGYLGLGSLETGLAPISFFSSGTEHGSFIITAGVILWAAILKNSTSRLSLVLYGLLFMLVLLGGSRGPLVKLLFISVILWAILGRNIAAWVGRGAVAMAIGVLGLFWGLNQVTQITADPTIEYQLSRQAELLNSKSEGSTLHVHLVMMLEGYEMALREPLGRGLGASSRAAMKFGERSYDTETDAGNVMISTGIFGGVAYHIMIILIIISCVRYWIRTRSTLALALVGILGVNFSLWLGGGQYFIGPFAWLCIGALDRYQNASE